MDTQTILAIDETVITRSARVTVRHSIDKDENLSTGQRKTWQLSLKEVTPADAGGYMCQLNNFEPMVSQVAYLQVTGNIISYHHMIIMAIESNRRKYIYIEEMYR